MRTLRSVEVARRLELLTGVGTALAESAESAGMSAPVPSCPGWTVRDLLAHVGTVHRWAGTIVGERRTGPAVEAAEAPKDGLVEWYRDGHTALVDALTAAPAELDCWSFLPSPSPLQFWSRRQLHETAIHRVDAGLANGESVAYGADLAADGVDEIITGFLPRPASRIHLPSDRCLTVRATDANRLWRVVIGPGLPVGVEIASGQPQPSDCTVSGPASDLYLLLWNRGDRSGLDVEGDVELLATWRTQLQVRWR